MKPLSSSSLTLEVVVGPAVLLDDRLPAPGVCGADAGDADGFAARTCSMLSMRAMVMIRSAAWFTWPVTITKSAPPAWAPAQAEPPLVAPSKSLASSAGTAVALLGGKTQAR
jgi:hypothetical protein